MYPLSCEFMKKIIVEFPVCLLFVFLGLTLSAAQTREELKRFEIGGHFTYLNLEDFNTQDEFFRQQGFRIAVPQKAQSEPGFGARFTYNLTENIGLEAEGNWFLRFTDTSIPVNRFERGGGKRQLLFGTKIGRRFQFGSKKIGFFGKARPGITRFANFATITEVIPGPPFDVPIANVGRGRNFFTVDLGGVVEFYPSKRTILRFDIGDTIIRYGKPGDPDIRNLNPTFTRHNLQFSAGFGFRF